MKHRITWYVYAGNERLRHTASMRGTWPGWDAECSCGWGSHTGGAIKARVKEAVASHKWEVENGWWHPDGIDQSEKGQQAIRDFHKGLDRRNIEAP